MGLEKLIVVIQTVLVKQLTERTEEWKGIKWILLGLVELINLCLTSN